MFKADIVTLFTAKAWNITALCIGKEINFREHFSCRLGIKLLFAVKNCLAFGIIFKEIVSHKGVGLMSASVINGAGPTVNSVIGNGVARAGLNTLTAVIAERCFNNGILFKLGIGYDKAISHTRAILGVYYPTVKSLCT